MPAPPSGCHGLDEACPRALTSAVLARSRTSPPLRAWESGALFRPALPSAGGHKPLKPEPCERKFAEAKSSQHCARSTKYPNGGLRYPVSQTPLLIRVGGSRPGAIRETAPQPWAGLLQNKGCRGASPVMVVSVIAHKTLLRRPRLPGVDPQPDLQVLEEGARASFPRVPRKEVRSSRSVYASCPGPVLRKHSRTCRRPTPVRELEKVRTMSPSSFADTCPAPKKPHPGRPGAGKPRVSHETAGLPKTGPTFGIHVS